MSTESHMIAEQKYQVELVGKTLKKIEKLYKKNKNHQIRTRLQIILLRCKSYSLQVISEIVLCSIQHIKNTISSYNHQGIEALLKLKYTGDPGNLTNEEKKSSKNILMTSVQVRPSKLFRG